MMNVDDIRDYLKENLRLELETKDRSFTGSIYIVATLKLGDQKICKAETALPDIAKLKRAEYDDY